tara:strand:+ start:1285 stop:1416 length:132 start_codon:yes stop_codon:yes gene_type:complete
MPLAHRDQHHHSSKTLNYQGMSMSLLQQLAEIRLNNEICGASS